MWCVLDESGTDGANFNRKVKSGRRIASAIRPLVNARDLQLECASFLHEILLVPVLMYGSEAMLWKVKESCRIRAVQLDNLKGLLGIRRMDIGPNEWIMELCKGERRVDERIDEGSLAVWRVIGLPRVCW